MPPSQPCRAWSSPSWSWPTPLPCTRRRAARQRTWCWRCRGSTAACSPAACCTRVRAGCKAHGGQVGGAQTGCTKVLPLGNHGWATVWAVACLSAGRVTQRTQRPISPPAGLTRAKQQLVVVSAGGEAGADPLAQAVRRKDSESRLTSLQVSLGGDAAAGAAAVQGVHSAELHCTTRVPESLPCRLH